MLNSSSKTRARRGIAMFKYETYKETTDLAILLKKRRSIYWEHKHSFFRYEFARMRKTSASADCDLHPFSWGGPLSLLGDSSTGLKSGTLHHLNWRSVSGERWNVLKQLKKVQKLFFPSSLDYDLDDWEPSQIYWHSKLSFSSVKVLFESFCLLIWSCMCSRASRPWG